MSSEDTFFSALSAAATVTALVGTGTKIRIFPDYVPAETALPAVAYTRAGTEYLNSISNAVLAQRATLEVWCLARKRPAADSLADTITPVLAAANFLFTGRRTEFEPENGIWATILTVDHWA